MKKYHLFLFLFLANSMLFSQVDLNQLPGNLSYRNIGPANQGGRIVDVEARANDFTKVYIATASGGVWKSQNAGTTWKPIFDHYETASIGDIALDPSNDDVIWVGTGESNNRNSVSWGNGIYKSVDGGEHFENMGLEKTHQIARVLVHPDNSDDVCACAIGHLWGYSGERGLFQTKNGGEKWKKLKNGLPNDGKTGCIDLVRDPKNPNTLYTAFYQRLRQPWHFESGGNNGGIFKSIDNGKTWKKLENGLPTGPTGRIGLAIYQQNPNIIMAIVEAEKTDTLAVPGSGVYRSEDGGAHWTYVNTYNYRPFYYSQIRINPLDDQKVYVLTTKFMVSKDGGKTFENGSKDEEIHGDFHAMWLDPNYEDRYYLGADKGFSLTHDQGAHFTLIDNLPIAQFYRVTYDMRDPYYVYGGLQDNGSYATASMSRDARGILNDGNWKMHWGDGQNGAVNPVDWTDSYSSMENGYYVKYNPKTRKIKGIRPNQINTRNYWDYFDKNETDMKSASRWNWSAPLMMSPHNSAHIYVGGNHVYRSTNKGVTWEIISPDLTTNDPQKRKFGVSGGVTPDNTGAETHCAIHTLSISPISEAILWVGTDDGNVQMTRDGGRHWENVRSSIRGVPEGVWVSRIEASRFEPGRAYLTFDGHRSDLFKSWIYVTEDYGKSWKKITKGIEGETVRVIREDIVNENLLFAGTETGVWFSINRGKKWSRLQLNMPTVSVYDMQIHPRENDLIVGTHGRSLWILDDISPLQQMSPEVAKKNIYCFDQKRNTLWLNISRGGQRGHFLFAGDNLATIKNTSSMPRAKFENYAAISFYAGAEVPDSVTLQITDLSNENSCTLKVKAHPGINRYYWNREFEALPYSPEELKTVTELLDMILASTNSNSTKKAYHKFMNSKEPKERRKIVERLTRYGLNFELNTRYLIPRAGQGTYQLTISSGGETSVGAIVIREDPMGE